ncbi:hypothetical protein ATANTOWER_002079, partial [Ataeniobius toweri]|nr:hypothetical protein [Ataeniobius toweri]
AQSLNRLMDQAETAAWRPLGSSSLSHYQAEPVPTPSQIPWRVYSAGNRRWSPTTKRQLP